MSVNKTFLILVLALVASVADAGGIRAHRGERNLKHSKSSKSGGYSQSTEPVDTNSFVFRPPVVEDANSVASFGQNCPASTENALDQCVKQKGGTDLDLEGCKICLVGISNMKGTVTRINVNSCSDIDVAGGRCKECFDEALAFYECGSDTTVAANVNANPISGVVGGGGGSTPSTGTTGGSTDVTMPAPGSYAPANACPTATPKSGDSCDTQGYDYMKCFYPLLMCTCRKDSPFYLCNEFDPSNPNPNGGR